MSDQESLADTVSRLLPHLDRTGKGDSVYVQLSDALTRELDRSPTYRYMQQAAAIRALIEDGSTRGLQAQERALEGVARSWELTDPACQALALADAQVWATLHLAEITQRVANQLDELSNLTTALREKD